MNTHTFCTCAFLLSMYRSPQAFQYQIGHMHIRKPMSLALHDDHVMAPMQLNSGVNQNGDVHKGSPPVSASSRAPNRLLKDIEMAEDELGLYSKEVLLIYSVYKNKPEAMISMFM